jgi:GntR family transcriptional regulator
VSRSTLREVMRIFEGQGLIRRRQGIGTFVVSNKQSIDTGLEVLESIENLAHRTGQSVSMGVMNIVQRDSTEEEAEALEVDQTTSLVEISRAILAAGRPVAYLVDRLPHNVLTPEELRSGFTGSVLDLLIKRGSPLLLNSKTEIRAVPATSEVARGDVLLCFVATLYCTEGWVVDYSHSYFLPGHFRFHVVRRIGTQTLP